MFTANKNEKIQIKLKSVGDNQMLNNENKTVIAFDKIFGYKRDENANSQIHICDFVNAEI